MIDEKFEEIIASNKGCAIIIAGSGSDGTYINKVRESLNDYEIPHIIRICSAHKQPEELMEIIHEFNNIVGLAAYVAIAGGTDALSGTLSFHTTNPVISCPPNGFNESCLTNPSGSSNAYIARPENVGKFIAQMYAGVNPNYKKLLFEKNSKKIEYLVDTDLKFQ